MSNYHILNTSQKLTKARVIFHIAIPDEMNQDSTNLRTAVFESQNRDPITSVVPNLEAEFATEYANMQTGAIYELSETVIFSDANLSNAQKRSEVDARYTELTVSQVDKFRKILRYWGMNRDVP